MWYHRRHCAAHNIFRLAPGLAFILRDIEFSSNYVVIDDILRRKQCHPEPDMQERERTVVSSKKNSLPGKLSKWVMVTCGSCAVANPI